MASTTATLDEQWRSKYAEKYHAIRSDRTSSTNSPQPSTSSCAQSELEDQLYAFIRAEVAHALKRFRTIKRFSRVRWILGALATTTICRNPLPLTGG